MAQVHLNEDTGLFESVVGTESVDDVVTPDQAEEVLDRVETEEDILDGVVAPAPSLEETVVSDPPDYLVDYTAMPFVAAPSDTAFNPQAWQVNLASNRSYGQHYLMYGDRISTGSYSWRYYLIVGSDIDYANDIYTYSDCDVYTYNSANSIVNYTREIGSGTVSGQSNVVYSDLYFDYVGTDPAFGVLPYILYFLLLIVILFLSLRGKR